MIHTLFNWCKGIGFSFSCKKTFSTIRHSYAFNRHFDSVSRDRVKELKEKLNQ